MKIFLFLFLVVISELSYAQFATFEPIISETPRVQNFNGIYNDNSSQNERMLNIIIQLQNQILDIKSNKEDLGLRKILDKYYDRLQGFKQYPQSIYLRENEINEIPLNLKKELIDYEQKKQSSLNTSNSDPTFEMGFSSSLCIENIWNAKDRKYDKIEENNINSEFYLTNNTISFKKGNNDWLINKWSYDRSDNVNGFVIFKDELNQMIYLDKESTMILYMHEYDGENYQKMSSYINLISNNNVTPPWINSSTFIQMK